MKKIKLSMVREDGVAWVRVSTKEQSEEGYSLDAQVKLLRGYGKQNNIKIVKEFILPESATGKQERKEFKKLLKYVYENPNVKHVLCEKVDRMTRNFKDAVKLDDWIYERSES